MEQLQKHRKLILILSVVALFGIFTWVLTGHVNGETMNVPIFESVPDEVVIYQGNMALVRDDMRLFSGKEVKITLPPQAIPSTLEIIDGGERIPTYKFLARTGADNRSSSDSSVQNLVTWNAKKTGERNVRLTYMMQGLSWQPHYSMRIINDQSVQFQYRVQILNNTSASATAKVKLVSGEIGSPNTGSGMFYRQMTNTQFKAAAYERSSFDGQIGSVSVPQIGATKISAHYVYDLPQVILEKNGVSFVTLFDKKLDAEKEYVWATTTGDRVDLVYTVKNSAEEPMAQGLVNVFEKDIFLGSDFIEWTPAGGKGHVTVGCAVDVQAEKTVDIEYDAKKRNDHKYYRHAIKLTVKNFSDNKRVVKVIDQKYPDSVEAQFSITPKSAGNNTRMWTLDIPPKGEKTVEYSFYSGTRYSSPYQQYN